MVVRGMDIGGRPLSMISGLVYGSHREIGDIRIG